MRGWLPDDGGGEAPWRAVRQLDTQDSWACGLVQTKGLRTSSARVQGKEKVGDPAQAERLSLPSPILFPSGPQWMGCLTTHWLWPEACSPGFKW